MTAPASTRLHITPFSADLLPVALGPALAKTAENISFLPIETFPENSYGFLDLPDSDAKSLMSKLNGAILRGKKMKIEKARPPKRPHHLVQEEPISPDPATKKAKKQKQKAKENILQGHELSPERKVKRGWTNPKPEESTRTKSKEKGKKSSKHQTPSRYTDKEELLFRTELPPNKALSRPVAKSKGEKQNKKEKHEANETVVHEFENTEIQPAFVRDTNSSAPTAQYIDGIGWMDGKGDVVEKSSPSASRKMLRKAEGLRIGIPVSVGAKTPKKQLDSPESTSPGGTSSSAGSDDPIATESQEDATSPSGSSSSRGRLDSVIESDGGQTGRDDTHNAQRVDIRMTPATPEKVHPLEALFKKPKPRAGSEAPKPSLEIETEFSFFDQSAAGDDHDDHLPPMPTTPFTSLDMHSRGVRSAAPTPDTAHPSRFASFASALATPPVKARSKDGITAEALSNDATVSTSEQSGERSQSEFEKRFWAERGQNNRAWKARRKSAVKEARQKEARTRRPRNW